MSTAGYVKNELEQVLRLDKRSRQYSISMHAAPRASIDDPQERDAGLAANMDNNAQRRTAPSCVGEIGTLEQALMHELFDNKIFLFIEHGGFRYMGFMQFDDPAFCSQIHNLLKANLGRTIEEIGDLDLFHTL